jgi:hypothetical protein
MASTRVMTSTAALRGSDGDSGADVDDHAAFGAEVGNGGLGDKEQSLDVEVEVLIDVFDGDGFDRKELIDAGVVDEDVETAEGFSRRRDELADVGGVGQVGLDGHGFAAGGLNALGESFGVGGAA